MSNEDSIFNKSNSENEKERNYYENKIIGGEMNLFEGCEILFLYFFIFLGNGSFVKNTEHCASNSYEGKISSFYRINLLILIQVCTL